TVYDLADSAVVADEETALAEVRQRRWGREGWGGFRRRGDGDGGHALGQPADGGLELAGEIAVAGDAETFRPIHGVLSAPVAQHHVRVIQEVAIDRNFGPLDGQWRDMEPVRVNMSRRFVERPLAQEHNVRHH